MFDRKCKDSRICMTNLCSIYGITLAEAYNFGFSSKFVDWFRDREREKIVLNHYRFIWFILICIFNEHCSLCVEMIENIYIVMLKNSSVSSCWIAIRYDSAKAFLRITIKQHFSFSITREKHPARKRKKQFPVAIEPEKSGALLLAYASTLWSSDFCNINIDCIAFRSF